MQGTLLRKPAVAGQFYPREPERLRETVRHYMDDAGVEPAPERVAAVVSPHAGYIYSGPTAGCAFARLRGARPRRVILIGCSHRCHISTAAVYTRGAFETPLGAFPIDEELAGTIADRLGAASSDPHAYEHSLEVQLPFLAEAVGKVPIVPILFGAPADARHARAGEQLAELTEESDLVVASTDLSHYNREAEAEAIDKGTLDAILSQDWRCLTESPEGDEHAMCGTSAVVAAMAWALKRGATEWSLLDYRTSARASGDYDRVVGYAAISMERPS